MTHLNKPSFFFLRSYFFSLTRFFTFVRPTRIVRVSMRLVRKKTCYSVRTHNLFQKSRSPLVATHVRSQEAIMRPDRNFQRASRFQVTVTECLSSFRDFSISLSVFCYCPLFKNDIHHACDNRQTSKCPLCRTQCQ